MDWGLLEKVNPETRAMFLAPCRFNVSGIYKLPSFPAFVDLVLGCLPRDLVQTFYFENLSFVAFAATFCVFHQHMKISETFT